jgi:hypothetical protein
MHFTVVWLPGAENDLARVWMQAVDRDAVTRASHTIDRLLRTDPQSKGQREGERFRLAVGPLVVLFRVYPEDRQVRVIAANSSEEF